VGFAMLEPQRVHRDADSDLPDTVTSPLLAHPPSPDEPSPATVGSPEITDEEIDAASAACCRICLESDSEPGEHSPPIDCPCSLPFSFLVSWCAKQKIVGPCNIGSASTFVVCHWIMDAAVAVGLYVWIVC
jgi:hypothetical protein